MDDSTRFAVLAAVGTDVARMWDGLGTAASGDWGLAEHQMRDGMLAIGARMLEASIAARGTGKAGPRHPCACGGEAVCEGYRPKDVQIVVGWITIRRAYYACPDCGHGTCPLDVALGLELTVSVPGCGGWQADLAAARRYLRDAPWPILFPGLAIFFLVMALNLAGDGLRDLLDPRRTRR